NPRSGRLLSVITHQNIDGAKDLVNDDPHIIIDYVAAILEEKIKVMAHPPYSPDLVPSDFWLFNYLKRDVDTCPDATSLAKMLSMELHSIPIHEYQKTFEK
ncbi:unnamed protein product, partial [Adineta steineri]